MRALDPEVQTVLQFALSALIPEPLKKPGGRGRPRISDRVCIHAMILRLVTGASWETIEFIVDRKVSDTTLRSRRDEWIDAGVFDNLMQEAFAAYDRIIGFDLTSVAIDGSNHRAPCGGAGTGRNPFDRGKLGWKWVMLVDTAGIPLAWVTDGANRNDFAMLTQVMDTAITNHKHLPLEKLHLDRGFSYKCTPNRLAAYDIEQLCMKPRRPAGQAQPLVGLGGSWIVESANSWFTNYGQLRRNTDRHPKHRLAAINLAVTIIITSRLIDYRKTNFR